jgi:hypothetical protein
VAFADDIIIRQPGGSSAPSPTTPAAPAGSSDPQRIASQQQQQQQQQRGGQPGSGSRSLTGSLGRRSVGALNLQSAHNGPLADGFKVSMCQEEEGGQQRAVCGGRGRGQETAGESVQQEACSAL